MAKKIKQDKVEEKIEIKDTESDEVIFTPAIAALIKENLKPNEILRYGDKDTELIIEVSHTTPVGTKIAAVESAADFLFLGEGDSIEDFSPALREFAKKSGVLLCYTNWVQPKQLYSAWGAILYTNIYDDVAKILGDDIVNDFTRCFDELVETRKQEIIHSTNWRKIADKIGQYASGIKDSFKDIDLSKFADGLKNIKGIEGLDLSELIQSFADSK